MLDLSYRQNFTEDHTIFRDSVRRFIADKLLPRVPRWEKERRVDRETWQECGAAGMIAPTVPAEYGGLGLDFRYNAIASEELAYSSASIGTPLQSDIIADYFVHLGSEDIKQAWLPGMVSGKTITAIAMTEPSAGSDLQGIRTTATRDGDNYVISGSKTYITNGLNADVVVVVARTNVDAGAKGISLILVEADRPGFRRGRGLEKIGQHSQDTAELFFDDVRVPVSNRLGRENGGFGHLMDQLPQERLSIAIMAQAGAQRAFDEAVTFTKQRKAFGKSISDFQNTRFVLADLKAKLQVGWAHIDWALQRHINRELTTYEASAAKLWHTELQWEVCDTALQLHGGAGYMEEYTIARLWRDARVQRIYGGTSEIMKELLGRSV